MRPCVATVRPKSIGRGRPILGSLTDIPPVDRITMKIKQIRAFAIKSDMAGGKAVTSPRRPSRLDSAEVAGPISRFALSNKLRSTWRPAAQLSIA